MSGRTVIASPKLAALKEAVFQVTMAELDPPLNVPALRGTTARLAALRQQFRLR